jgi:hypothetical protein
MMTPMPPDEVQVVRDIIEDQFRTRPYAYREGVLWHIEHSHDLTRPYLHHRAEEAGKADGHNNVRIGAELVYADALARLPDYRQCRNAQGDAVIRRRVAR